MDRVAAWIREQIRDHTYTSNPRTNQSALLLAEAWSALNGGYGQLFGMGVPAKLDARDELRGDVLEALEEWVRELSGDAFVQLARLIERLGVPIDIAGYRKSHEQQKRETREKTLAKDAHRNPELERQIAEDPDAIEPYLVYGDWLQQRGDPRGELMVLQARRKSDPRLIAKVLEPLRDYLDGEAPPTFAWHRGYVQRVKLSDKGVLEKLLLLPIADRLEKVVAGSNGINDGDLQDIIDVLITYQPATLRTLFLGDFEYPGECEMSWFKVGDLSRLWAALPHLRSLIVQGGSFTLGEIAHAGLGHLEVRTGGLPPEQARLIAKAKLPALRHLDIWYGESNYGGDATIDDVELLLHRDDLRALTHLGLKNASFTDEICEAVVASPLLPQLRELDLSMGTLGEAGAATLLAHAEQLKHLAMLDLSDNYIPDELHASLATLCENVVLDNQQEADEEDRYPTVGE